MRKFTVIFFFFILILTVGGCKQEDEFALAVEQSSLSLYVGESLDLDYTITNNDVEVTDIAISYLVQDQSIVSFDGTTIEALSIGSTKLDLYLTDHPTIKIAVQITVTPSLILGTAELDLYVGEEVALTYEDLADQTSAGVTITTSKTGIVTVTDDMVQAIGTGTVRISIVSNTNQQEGEIVVNVTERPIEEVTIAAFTDDVYVYDNVVLSASILPANANQNILWTSSDPTVASISSNGQFNALKQGTVTFTATSAIDETKQSTITVTIGIDPIKVFTHTNIENPLHRTVPTFGNTQKTHEVFGSVNQYFFADMNLRVNLVPVNQNEYTGQVATPTMITLAEGLKKVRPGILHEETMYITYHETGNNSIGSTALANGNWMVSADNASNRARSWHYTVDDEEVIQHIPDNEVSWQGDHYDSYAKSIGVETCVDEGSDLFTTWQRTAKFMASLLVNNGLDVTAIRQHYDFNGKDCPQTLRTTGLYTQNIEFIKVEYLVLTELADYDFTFTSLSPEYVDNRGRIIALPATATRIGYRIHVTNGVDYDQSVVLYSTIPGLDGTTVATLPGETADLEAAQALDQEVAALSNIITSEDSAAITLARSHYDALTPVQKTLTTTLPLLEAKEADFYRLSAVDTSIVIKEIMPSNNNVLKYGYILLQNTTDEAISLAGYTLQHITSTTEKLVFGATDVISAHQSYLIQLEENNNQNTDYLPLPDKLWDTFLDQSGVIVLTNADQAVTSATDSHVVDLIGFGSSATLFEGTVPNTALVTDQALTRREAIDTNQSNVDFVAKNPAPVNSKEDKLSTLTADQEAAMTVDLAILALPFSVTQADEASIEAARAAYTALTAVQQGHVQLLVLLEEIELNLEELLYPDLAAISRAVRSLPENIVMDYTFPTTGGVSWAYKAGQDTTYFDLVNGISKKVSYKAKLVTLIATCNAESREVTVNFGIADADQIAVFNTGALNPAAGGKTSDGKGTAAEQEATIGFGGKAIVVADKVFYIGYNAYIPLTKPTSGTTLTMADLRPYGSSSDTSALYNQDLRKGVPTAYAGSGALYQNTSDVALSFNPSYTYGRNNSSSYGYGKVVFSPNEDGTYTVRTKWLDSGTNTNEGNRTETLLPGEYLWCPHTYETNQNNGGTYLIQPGVSTVGGVLTVDAVLEIIDFKTVFN